MPGGSFFVKNLKWIFPRAGSIWKDFPMRPGERSAVSVLKEEDRDLFLKGEPQGDLILREAIREYLHAARGVNCDASQIIIGAGNEYLLMLLSQLHRKRCGDRHGEIPPTDRHTGCYPVWGIRSCRWGSIRMDSV